MRPALFIVLAVVGFLGPAWLFVLGAVAYALWRPAYELIALGFVFDAFFGNTHALSGYFYTILFGVLVIAAEFLKPYVSYYDRSV